jgi:nitroreductase
MTKANHRVSAYAIDPLFLKRWSPRAFDGSKISDRLLFTLFEAAGWAPSAFNQQPWRFIYCHRDDPSWERLLGLLLPFNAVWAQRASVLVFVISDTMIQLPGKPGLTPSHSHSFDAGAAWAYMGLQAAKLGLHMHGMTGVDFNRARTELKVPDRFHIDAAIVIGRRAAKSVLPVPLQGREAPSGRKPVSSYIMENEFSEDVATAGG